MQICTMDDRFTMANMAIEAGAKNGIFPVDEKTEAYLEEHTKKDIRFIEADEDADYERGCKDRSCPKSVQQLHSRIFREMQRQSMRLRPWSRSRSIRW